MNWTNVAPNVSADNGNKCGASLQRNAGGLTAGVCNPMDARSPARGNAKSVGSSSVNNSLELFASWSCGTFVTGRGAGNLCSPKIKTAATCATKTSATSISQMCNGHRPLPFGFGAAGLSIFDSGMVILITGESVAFICQANQWRAAAWRATRFGFRRCVRAASNAAVGRRKWICPHESPA